MQRTGEPVLIERRGKPVVAVVPASQVEPTGAGWDSAVDAEIDTLLADTPAPRAVVEVGRQVRPAAPRGLAWDDALAAARDEYAVEKARKKGPSVRPGA